MTVFGGLQFGKTILDNGHIAVSIPMTVFGGLQFVPSQESADVRFLRFNTDDGIWRATINEIAYDVRLFESGVSIPMTVFGGLQ